MTFIVTLNLIQGLFDVIKQEKWLQDDRHKTLT
jgi:hypothetical protein